MEDNLHHNADPKLFYFARLNRKAMTEAEKILWANLRNRKLRGFKFRRQHPIADFIADFFCLECNLVVEIDGGYQNDIGQALYDKEKKTCQLNKLNIKAIRFTNEEVISDLDAVLSKIEEQLVSVEHLIPGPSPAEKGANH